MTVKRWSVTTKGAGPSFDPKSYESVEVVAAEDYDRACEELDNVMRGRNYHYLISQRANAIDLAAAIRPCVKKLRELGNQEPLEVAKVLESALTAFDRESPKCPECGGTDYIGVEKNGKCADCLWEYQAGIR